MAPCILGLSTVIKGRLYRTAVKPAIGRAAQTKASVVENYADLSRATAKRGLEFESFSAFRN